MILNLLILIVLFITIIMISLDMAVYSFFASFSSYLGNEGL